MIIVTCVVIIGIYLAILIGYDVGFLTTNFVRPKRLWNLVPFRVSGWRSRIDSRKIYVLNWTWESLDFNKYIIEV